MPDPQASPSDADDRQGEPEDAATHAAAAAAPEAGERRVAGDEPSAVAWQRLRTTVTMRPSRGQLIIAVLCALLGFAAVVQIRTTATDQTLTAARPEDLVRLLDALDARSERLDAEIADLERARDRIAQAQDRAAAARREQEQRELELGVLAGTVAASGPGALVTFNGPVDAGLVLDAVQELRDAGAEAMQINDVRIVASTSFVDGPREGVVVVDGVRLVEPLRISAIGDPQTLTSAMRIPGGIVDAGAADGVSVVVAPESDVTVDAVRPLPSPSVAAPE